MTDKEKLLRKYFAGKPLNDLEQQEISTLLKEDADFNQKFQSELEKDVQPMVQIENRAQLKARLQALEEREKLSMPPKMRPWKPLGIAASIILLLGLAWYLNLYNTSQDYFEDYYNIYPNTEVIITRDLPQSIKTDAFSAYEMEEFAQAALLFKRLKSESSAGYIDFYLGQSYLHLGQTDKAIIAFQNTIDQDNKYKAEALWYLALAHLKLKEFDKATTLLEQLVADYAYKNTEAQALLDQLK